LPAAKNVDKAEELFRECDVLIPAATET